MRIWPTDISTLGMLSKLEINLGVMDVMGSKTSPKVGTLCLFAILCNNRLVSNIFFKINEIHEHNSWVAMLYGKNWDVKQQP